LGLPEGVYPVAGLCAGYAGEKRDVSLRLPPAIVVHTDIYNDASLETHIDGYDARRNAIRPMRQLMTDEYGESDSYGWSENAARRLSVPEARHGFRAFLQSHGFDLD